ncbi:MAG TPA: dethiobiotin synthase [Nitrospina sp.]|nr:dethiobiotin synthase [Nitrospina sp.]
MKSKGYFISGTDTGVGKTVVTACLLALYHKRSVDLGVMKPMETGIDPECSSEANSDAKFLLAVSGNQDALEEVCPIRLQPPAAPLQAARMTGQTIAIDSILENFRKLQTRHDQILVEGVGGLMVPLKPDYFITDLIRDMDLPLIIVSRLTLGTLNHTLLTLKTAQSTGIEIAGVILNRSDNNPLNDVEKGQANLIHELSGVPIIGECPFINPVSVERFDNQLAEEIAHWKL